MVWFSEVQKNAKICSNPFYFAGSNCWFLGWISKKPSFFSNFRVFGRKLLSKPAGCEFSWVLMVGVLTGCTWNPKTTSLKHEWKRLSNCFLCKDLESSNWNNQVLNGGFQIPGIGTWFRCSGQEGWRRLDVLQKLVRKWLVYQPTNAHVGAKLNNVRKPLGHHGPSHNLTRIE